MPAGGLIVEIGVFAGLSLLTIAEACKANSVRIVGIDLWDSTDLYFPKEDSRGRRERLQALVMAHWLPAVRKKRRR